jgi:hypothetical protein
MVGTCRLPEFVACWLFGIGLISLALNPTPVEEQPVASTTATASITPGNDARQMWSKKAPEQWRWPLGESSDRSTDTASPLLLPHARLTIW